MTDGALPIGQVTTLPHAPDFHSNLDLRVPPRFFTSGLDGALRRPPRIRFVEPASFYRNTAACAYDVQSQFLQRRLPQIQSFQFAAPAALSAESATGAQSSTSNTSNRKQALPESIRQVTRLKPPGDVVKLSDRLYFLLQPPLQTFLEQESLALPFPPFPYQWDGVAFLYPRIAAILADEMGLGKTMQAITTIRLLLRSGEIRSVLLVCPKPLVTNWRKEFATWAPELPVAIVEGPHARRHWQWSQVAAPIKLANYEVVLRDQPYLTEQDAKFDLVVLDEAQRIKNRRSATSDACCSLPRRRSWALTGTPVENSGEDLLGLFEFLSPGYLSADMPLHGLGRAAGDYILRRTKQLVLKDLPPKLIRDARLELAPEQRQAYELAKSNGTIRLSELGDKITIQHVLELVLRLKQICNFDPAHGSSPKLDQLQSDVEEITASGKKAIVFSQWVDTLSRIKQRLQSAGVLEFHGKISMKQREANLQRFREDDNVHVMLMTYGAGSVGLNLQFASYVFLFDRWWNPAVEDQAINRAHRIGATGPVTVTRFISADTIEERIHDILEQKRELFEMILSHASTESRIGLSQQELFSLFQ